MSNLENLLKDKTVADFTREQLVQLAIDHEVSFKQSCKNETLFKKLVDSFEEEKKEEEEGALELGLDVVGAQLEEEEEEEEEEVDYVELEETKLVTVEFLVSPAGKFLLPYSVGEKVPLPAPLANELIEAKYAK